jgi:hypothetical protein
MADYPNYLPDFLSGDAAWDPDNLVYDNSTAHEVIIVKRRLKIAVPPPRNIGRDVYFFVVAYIVPSKTHNDPNPYFAFEPEWGSQAAFHSPRIYRAQGDTTTPLWPESGRRVDDRSTGFLVRRGADDDVCAAGTYVVYNLKRRELGERILKLEARWDLDWGREGRAVCEAGTVNASSMPPPGTYSKRATRATYDAITDETSRRSI